jgi:hypothetical protein
VKSNRLSVVRNRTSQETPQEPDLSERYPKTVPLGQVLPGPAEREVRGGFARFLLCASITVVALTQPFSSSAHAAQLLPRNTEVPFSYVAGGERSWPILDAPLIPDDALSFTASADGKPLGSGVSLAFNGIRIALSDEGRMTISADSNATAQFQLLLSLSDSKGAKREQRLTIRPAPPNRPISYLSDQVDDLIRIFWDNPAGKWRPIEKSAFDQYFRRLQAHGVQRLIVWQSAFPLINDPANYRPEDWDRFEKQARAILDDKELNQILYSGSKRKSYQWQGFLMRFRLTPEWGRMYAQSAADHGISLTASYRPFEAALKKYYVVPSFDHDGRFLWNFLPGATPTTNYRAKETGFAHYRKILQRAGRDDEATMESVTFESVPESEKQAASSENLRIFAAAAPPIDQRSFVLARNQRGQFQLKRFEAIAAKVESHRIELKGWTLKSDASGSLQITGLKRPSDKRYLIFKTAGQGPNTLQLPVELPVTVRSRAGARLGRVNAYWALGGDDAESASSRIAGIAEDGGYRTDFQAIENSSRLVRKSGKALRSLDRDEIVIDFGDDWSQEMIDFNRAAARTAAVKELKTIIKAPAFDEIIINTRSHTQLAGSSGDGDQGIQTIGHHRRHRKNYFHLGIDRAYAPVSVAESDPVRSFIQANTIAELEKITTWQPGEWQGTCQSKDTPYPWRYARNAAVASGVRRLLGDLENEFPETRIRVVIPPRARVEAAVTTQLPGLKKPTGGNYDAKYYRYLSTRLNHIPAIGEGMAMIDLTGLRAEPVFLGLRHMPDPEPVKVHLDAFVSDQSDNHGSNFRGAKSFFYEAQETLRAKDKQAAQKRREEIIRELLAREAINEVILYEAADWTYYLPIDDPHKHLDTPSPNPH